MHEKLCFILLIILIAPTTDVLGKEENQTIANKGNKHHHNTKPDVRKKRSLNENFQPKSDFTRAKRQNLRIPNINLKYDNDEKTINFNKISDRMNEPPFWGTRGRRESSENNYIDAVYVPPKLEKFCKYCRNIKFCKYCFGNLNKIKYDDDGEDSWERPSRNSLVENDDDGEPFWGNRGRRQEQDEPFWGNRGRRQDDSPFWGTRGRREKSFSKFHTRMQEEDDPFWGNRGRRQESEPFWGNRGRRMQTDEPKVYENDESGPFWGNRGRRKQDLKDAIIDNINDVEDKIEQLSRIRKREDYPTNSFWGNRGRTSKLKHLFMQKLLPKSYKHPYESDTVLDDRMYVDEPHYILVERSSRSSGEDDPYFISRGKKKYFIKTEMDEAARNRRGAIEEIVKSVRNDPYYIVRGKKDDDESKFENSTNHDDLTKVKELICSSIDLVTNHGNKVKRDTTEENDRDRRNILKKLAAQLQIDPYFVSRGKKNGNPNSVDFVEDFVNQVAEKCHN